MSTERAAWRALGSPSPAQSEQDHVCASCGRQCALCRDGKPCGLGRYCSWCANAYALNAPDPDDGVVYCGGPDPEAPSADLGCGARFPALAQLIEAGLSQYPLFCGPCREKHRAEAAEERTLTGDSAPEPLPTPRGSASPPPVRPAVSQGRLKSEQRPGSTAPRGGRGPRDDADAQHLRGGFRPRDRPRDALEREDMEARGRLAVYGSNDRSSEMGGIDFD